MDGDVPAITLTDPHNQDAAPQSPVKSPASSNAALARKQVTNPGSPAVSGGTLSQSDSPSSSSGWQSSFFHALSNSNAHVRTTSSVGTDVHDNLDNQHESQSHIDPLSQHIMRRTNATPNTSNVRPSTAEDTTRDDRKRSAEGREAVPVQDPQALSRTETEETTSHKDLRKGVKAVAFLSRLMGNTKRKEQEDEVNSDTASIAERPEGNNAQVFTDSLDNLGYSPRYPQPPAYIKVRSRNKRVREFDHMFLAQELDAVRRPKLERQNSSNKLRRKSSGPSEANTIWAMEFSRDGKYLAAAGADMIVRIWAVLTSSDDRSKHENQESSDSMAGGGQAHEEHLSAPVFQSAPIREYEGHSQTILDLSWSKNNFLLSSSMDKTVRLWHVSRAECLCTFKHNDFVPSIAFHPKDDRFFLAGSLDSKLRLWSIPDKSVAYSARVGDMITAVAFTPDGKYAAAGCLGGLCVFYETDGFKYQTRIHVRSTRGQNAKGSKITGIQSFTAMDGSTKLLISSNDSRIRLYNFKDQSLEVKLKGNENTTSQIRAMLSDDGKYVVCGSEDRKAFIWSLQGDDQEVRRDKRPVEYFEANDTMTTAACIAPAKTKALLSKSEDPVYDICNPPPVTLMSREHRAESQSSSRPRSENGSIQQTPRMTPMGPPTHVSTKSAAYANRSSHSGGGIIVTADYFGKIKVFRQDCAWNKRKPEIDWDRSSMFAKPNNGGKLSRQGSTATRASQKSVRDSRNSTSTQPSSERILSWRQGITSTSSIADSSQRGSSKATSRSISPQRSLELRTKNVNLETSKSGPDSAGTTRSAHPLAAEAMTASPPPPETPRQTRKETMASTMTPDSDAYTDAREDGEDNNPMDIAGGQSYLFWDMEIWKRRKQEQLDRQRAELDVPQQPGSEKGGPQFLGPARSRSAHSYVSRLSDEISTDTENEHYDDAQENHMKCSKCGGRSFSARKNRGKTELACTACGTAA